MPKDSNMMPEHSNPKRMRIEKIKGQMEKFWGYAPYNFIPLPENVVTIERLPSQDVYTSNTGFIECRITTESPIYIRCPMSVSFFKECGDKPFEFNEAQKKEYSKFFFTQNPETPVIPGSSIRGMVRELVEIVGYGKIQWVTDKKLIYRGVGDKSSLGLIYRDKFLGPEKQLKGNKLFEYPSKNIKGGYLEKINSKWHIRPAREINGETFVHVEYSAFNCGSHNPKDEYNRTDLINVYVKPPQNRKSPPRSKKGLLLNLSLIRNSSDIRITKGIKPLGYEKAVIVRSGDMRGKHMYCAIYEQNMSAQPIEIPDTLWSLYESDKDMTRGFKSRPISEGDPLFYLVDGNNLVFFGPTMMFRIPHDNEVIRFVPEELRKQQETDLAEAIFGYTPKKTSNTDSGFSGRVFFTDAKLESSKDGIWLTEDPIIPKVFASPKPTAFQNYLVQDINKGHNPDIQKELAHYSLSEKETVIRGHKMYWHKGNVKLAELIEDDKKKLKDSPKQYTKIKPVKSGVAFSSRIYFENLENYELGSLLWVLKIPGEKGQEYRHKIGMGKPLGMGAIKIESKLYLSKRKERYSKLFDNNYWNESILGISNEEENELIESFETFVLNKLPGNKSQIVKLNQMDRIKMLLEMMKWKGPDSNLTRYLSVDEFRARPVLPDPLNIAPPENG